MKRPGHCLYVFEAIDGSFKVGRTGNLLSRAATLTSQHGPLKLLWRFDRASRAEARDSEEVAHRLLRFWRIGGEWFKADRWAKQLLADWCEAGCVHRPDWLFWLSLETKEPLPNWRELGPQSDTSWRWWLI